MSTCAPSDLSSTEVKGQMSISLQTDRPHKPGNNGLGQCPHCLRPVHYVAEPESPGFEPDDSPVRYLRHNPERRKPTGLEPIHDNDRTHCSQCGRPYKAYELKPGDGRCIICAP